MPVKTFSICGKFLIKLSHWAGNVCDNGWQVCCMLMTDDNVIIMTLFSKKMLPYMLDVGKSRKIRPNQGKFEVLSWKAVAMGW